MPRPNAMDATLNQSGRGKPFKVGADSKLLAYPMLVLTRRRAPQLGWAHEEVRGAIY